MLNNISLVKCIKFHALLITRQMTIYIYIYIHLLQQKKSVPDFNCQLPYCLWVSYCSKLWSGIIVWICGVVVEALILLYVILIAAHSLRKYNVPEEIKVGIVKAGKQICRLAESSNAGNLQRDTCRISS